MELFQRCLALQEYQYTESQTQDGTMSDDPSMETSDLPDSEEGGVSLTSDEEPPQDDRWATIVEPVTNNTLVDTVLAQLETLTLLCNLIPSSSDPTPLTFITEYSSNLLSPQPSRDLVLSIRSVSPRFTANAPQIPNYPPTSPTQVEKQKPI